MNLQKKQLQFMTRRHFLGRTGIGLGAMSLASLQGSLGSGGIPGVTSDPLSPKAPHFAPKAKRVIYLHMAGSPPQLDLFDYKPKLQQMDGELCPKSFFEGKRLAFIKGHPKLLGSPYRFQQHGASGQWMSELLPHFSGVADEVTVVKSMFTDQFNHAPAQLLLHTGTSQFGGASMGSWITYGLGSQNRNLPGYVVLVSGGTDPSGGKSLWSSGFLPSVYQGVQCRSRGEPILYVTNPEGINRKNRRHSLDALKELNELEHREFGDPETLTRIEQFELAFRMQMSVPEVMDIKKESIKTQESYGAVPGQASFANNCLLARRLVEKGVRFVQLFDWGWDIHGTQKGDDLMHQFPKKCRNFDRPATALIRDLKNRGLLDETLVIWGGEFGRTSMNEARNGSKFLGRDHHPDCFTIWMAGGGIKKGLSYGSTDEFGYTITENKVSIHDLQATVLHCLGLDPHHFSYPFQGLNQRLVGPAE
ncbi:MAG TPA: DUF1501 domain-containing protein, partial [Verrucomicrobia bacterium]|nr:DUF1501 domain-containing protein [Verrucomicrobiota bacterium]